LPPIQAIIALHFIATGDNDCRKIPITLTDSENVVQAASSRTSRVHHPHHARRKLIGALFALAFLILFKLALKLIARLRS